MNVVTNLPVRAITSLQAAAISRKAQLDERGSATAEYVVIIVAIVAVLGVVLKTIAGSVGERLIEALVNAIFDSITGLFKK